MRKPKRRSAPNGKRQLAALATLLGLMQTASKLSRELDGLAGDIGGSLEDITREAGIPYYDVHGEFVERLARKAAKKAAKKK